MLKTVGFTQKDRLLILNYAVWDCSIFLATGFYTVYIVSLVRNRFIELLLNFNWFLNWIDR